MPFVSQAQRSFMYAKHPKIAAKIEGETPKGKKLPKHVKAAEDRRASVGKKKGKKRFKRQVDGRFSS